MPKSALGQTPHFALSAHLPGSDPRRFHHRKWKEEQPVVTWKDLHLQGLLFKKEGLKNIELGATTLHEGRAGSMLLIVCRSQFGVPWGLIDLIYSVSSLRDPCTSWSAEAKANVFCITMFDWKNQWFEKRLIVVAPEGPPAQPCHAPGGHPHRICRHNFFPHCLLQLSVLVEFSMVLEFKEAKGFNS